MSEYVEDEWEDVVGAAAVAKTPTIGPQIQARVERAPSHGDLMARFSATEPPVFTQDQLSGLAEGVPLENFLQTPSGWALMRCESASRAVHSTDGTTTKVVEYPGFLVSAKLRGFPYLWVTVELYNGTHKAVMRTPDLKMRPAPWHCRRGEGLMVRTSDKMARVTFKKKCVHKPTGKDLAFELGKKYDSYTDGATPQFVFVVVPFDGRFRVEDAVRSPKFQVKSKRQERFLQPANKRRKLNPQLAKLDTDIASARQTLKSLQAERRRLDIVASKYRGCFEQVKALIPHMHNKTLRLALAFALQDDKAEDSASF